MVALRPGAAMVPRHVGDDDLLLRINAEQPGMEDEMIRVLVVPFVADVVPDVVEERRIGQCLPVGFLAAESRA